MIIFAAKQIIQPIMFMKTQIILTLLASILLRIHSHNSMDRSLLRARNQYLRFYIYSKKSHIKTCILAASNTIKERTNRIYNSILSKYYDAHTAYYSLPPEDLELIEQIINLHF